MSIQGLPALKIENCFERNRIKLAFCKISLELHQAKYHVDLDLPFISTIVSFASTLPVLTSHFTGAAYSNVQIYFEFV